MGIRLMRPTGNAAKRHPMRALPLLLLLTPAPALAQAAEETIVVTGRGLRAAPGEEVFSTAVIGRERLQGSASNRLEDILRDRFGSLRKPAISGLSFGHIEQKLTLPVGVMATLEAEQPVPMPAGLMLALPALRRLVHRLGRLSQQELTRVGRPKQKPHHFRLSYDELAALMLYVLPYAATARVPLGKVQQKSLNLDLFIDFS